MAGAIVSTKELFEEELKARKGFAYQDPKTIDRIIIHDTGTEKHEKPYPYPERGNWISSIRESHKSRGFTDIGYHYLIDRDGTVTQAREHHEVGAHAKGRNTGAIGISMLGHKSFTPEQEEALRSLRNQLNSGFGRELKVEEHQKGDPNTDWKKILDIKDENPGPQSSLFDFLIPSAHAAEVQARTFSSAELFGEAPPKSISSKDLFETTDQEREDTGRMKTAVQGEITRLETELQEAKEAKLVGRPSYANIKPLIERQRNLQQAIDVYKRMVKEGDSGFWEEFGRGVSDTLKEPEKLIPFAGSIGEVVDMVGAMGIAKRLETGEEVSPYEMSVVEKYRAKGLDKTTMGYNVGAMMSQMPTYIAEFAFTMPVKVGVQAAVKPLLRNFLGRKSATIMAGTVGAIAQGAVNVPMVAENTTRFLLDNYEELESPIFGESEEKEDMAFAEALARGFGQTAVEYTTEYMGRFVTKPLRFLKKAFLNKWINIKGTGWNKLARKVKFDGIIGEVFEEEIGEPIQALLEEREYKAPMLTPEGTERLMTEILGIGAFGGMAQGVGMMIQKGELPPPETVIEPPVAPVEPIVEPEVAKAPEAPEKLVEKPIIEPTEGVEGKVKQLEAIVRKPAQWVKKSEEIRKTTGQEKEEWIAALKRIEEITRPVEKPKKERAKKIPPVKGIEKEPTAPLPKVPLSEPDSGKTVDMGTWDKKIPLTAVDGILMNMWRTKGDEETPYIKALAEKGAEEAKQVLGKSFKKERVSLYDWFDKGPLGFTPDLYQYTLYLIEEDKPIPADLHYVLSEIVAGREGIVTFDIKTGKYVIGDEEFLMDAESKKYYSQVKDWRKLPLYTSVAVVDKGGVMYYNLNRTEPKTFVKVIDAYDDRNVLIEHEDGSRKEIAVEDLKAVNYDKLKKFEKEIFDRLEKQPIKEKVKKPTKEKVAAFKKEGVLKGADIIEVDIDKFIETVDPKTSLYTDKSGTKWKQIAALWQENLDQINLGKEEYWTGEIKKAKSEGAEIRLIKFEAVHRNKKGQYKNYKGEWQDKPVYTYYLQKSVPTRKEKAKKVEKAAPTGGAGVGMIAASGPAGGGGYGTILPSEKKPEEKVAKTDYSKVDEEMPGQEFSVVDEVLKIVSPAERKGALMGKKILRKNIADLAHKDVVATETLRKAHKAFKWMSKEDTLDFIDRMETGREQKTGKLQNIAATLDGFLVGRRTDVQNIGKGHLESYIENYFPHIWKDPKKAKNVIASIMGKKRLEGTKAFLKKRVIVSVKEGVERGLELVSDNPVDIVLLKLHEMDRYIMAQNIIRELKSHGLIKFVYSRSQAPEGYVRVDDSAFTIYMPPEITKKDYYDQIMVDDLMSIADSLGIDTKRFVSIGRGRYAGLAYGRPGFKGGERVRTKYASPESVLAHEIGHILGFRYNLYDLLGRRNDGEWREHTKGKKKGQRYFVTSKEAIEYRKEIDQQWRDLADARSKDIKRAGPGFQGYVRKSVEKEAVMLEALIHAPEQFRKVAPNLYKVFTAFLNNNAELRPILDIKPSLVLGVNDAKIKVPGFTTLGHYYAPEPTGTLLNNYLSPGLRNNKNKLIAGGYNLLRGAGNVLNQAQLSLSLFHALNVTTDIMASTFGLGLRRMLVKGQRVKGITDIAFAPVAPIAAIWQGTRIKKAYKQQIDTITNPKLKEMVEAIIAAGGRERMDVFYYNNQIKALENTFTDIVKGDAFTKIKSTFKLPFNIFGATLEALAKPLMEWYVPTGKMGLFSKLAQHEMERAEAGQINEEQLWERLTQSWDSVDNRMGQLVYDNLFWEKTLKDSLMLAIRSVGWNLGSWREFAGSVVDIATVQERIKRGDVWLSHKMAYTIGAVTLYSVLGATIQYALTGVGPEEPKDYLFPKTGKLNPDGSEERLSLPTYAKDWYAWSHQPFKTMIHKVHPLWGLLGDLATNKDFFNVEVRHTDDPIIQQAGQVVAHIAKNFKSISIRNFEKMSRASSDFWRNFAVSITGITSAPAYITRSPAQKLMIRYIIERIPPKTKTKEQFERSIYRRTLKGRLRKGERIDANEARELLGNQSYKTMLKEAKREPFADSFNRLSIRDALNVYAIANDEERKQVKEILKGKFSRAKSFTKTPELRNYYNQLISE